LGRVTGPDVPAAKVNEWAVVKFRRERIAIFVDGCFWHGCPRCFRLPTTNVDYWATKIRRNVSRDRRQNASLRADGWVVVRVWEHSLKRPKAVAARVRRALDRRGQLAGR
jgi:DNA mismatch endonuclease (patch repair protein)